MTVAAFAVAVAALFAAAVALATGWGRSSLKTLERRRAIVTVKTGEAFAGVLYAVDRESLRLRNAELVAVTDKRAHLPVDGEVLILRADVAYLQLP